MLKKVILGVAGIAALVAIGFVARNQAAATVNTHVLALVAFEDQCPTADDVTKPGVALLAADKGTNGIVGGYCGGHALDTNWHLRVAAVMAGDASLNQGDLIAGGLLVNTQGVTYKPGSKALLTFTPGEYTPEARSLQHTCPCAWVAEQSKYVCSTGAPSGEHKGCFYELTF